MDRDEAEKIVVSVIEKHVSGLDLQSENMSQSLTDLGVDSLETMIVIMEISEATSIDIDDDRADQLDTPEKIVDFLSQ